MAKTTDCPVAALIPEILQAWDAMNGAEKRATGDSLYKEVSTALFDLKENLGDAVSFRRAQSLAGAALQVALARSEVDTLINNMPEEQQEYHLRRIRHIERLLISATVMMSTMIDDPDVRRAVEIYSSPQEPEFGWLGEIETLAKQGRPTA